MKFLKEFPWVGITRNEKKNINHLYRDTCGLVKMGYGKFASIAKEHYPTYKQKAKVIARKGYDSSKEICSSFLRKVKDKYSRRP